MPGVGEVEAGEAVGAVAEHGDVQRLQALERRAGRRGSTSRPRTRRRCRCAPACRGRPTRRRCRCAPRCTPPSPPVANTRMPARSARCDGGGDGRRAVAAARGHGRQVADAALGDVVGVGERRPAPRRRARSGRRRGSRSSPARRRPRAGAFRASGRPSRRASAGRRGAGQCEPPSPSPPVHGHIPGGRDRGGDGSRSAIAHGQRPVRPAPTPCAGRARAVPSTRTRPPDTAARPPRSGTRAPRLPPPTRRWSRPCVATALLGRGCAGCRTSTWPPGACSPGVQAPRGCRGSRRTPWCYRLDAAPA